MFGRTSVRFLVSNALSLLGNSIAAVALPLILLATTGYELAAGTLRVIDLEGLAILHDIAFIRLKNSVFEREFQNLFADL